MSSSVQLGCYHPPQRFRRQKQRRATISLTSDELRLIDASLRSHAGEDAGALQRKISMALQRVLLTPNAKVSRGAETPEESAAGATSARPLG